MSGVIFVQQNVAFLKYATVCCYKLNTNTIRKKSESPVCQIGTDQYFNAVSMYDQNGAWKNYLLSQKNDAKMFVAQYQITTRGDGKHELHFYDADGGWICKFTSD